MNNEEILESVNQKLRSFAETATDNEIARLLWCATTSGYADENGIKEYGSPFITLFRQSVAKGYLTEKVIEEHPEVVQRMHNMLVLIQK